MSEYVIAKYLRLSLEDGDLDPLEKDESNSISNQRKLLDNYINEKLGECKAKILEFVDDGKSGTNFDRPAVTKLLNMAKAGKVNCIIVKDFSRWGRNYIAVGDYLEQIFPFLQIRFIAVNDDYDSDKLQYGSAGMVDVGFKNIMHDLYSKELSQKLKLTKRQLFAAGKYHSSFSFYGYLKSPKEKYKLVIDNETANVVRKIFKWAERGMKTMQIAKKLNDKNIPTPMMSLTRQKNFKWFLESDNHGKMWTSSAVMRILKDERYTGKCIYGKTKVAGIGSKKCIPQPPDQWIIVPNVFPVIVSQERYDRVQPKLKKHIKQNKHKNNRLFSGNIRCGHCGYALAYHPAEFSYYQCHTHVVSDSVCYGNRILESELAEIILSTAKKYAQAAIERITETDKKRKVEQGCFEETERQILNLKKMEAKLLAKNNELFEMLMDKKIDDVNYREQTGLNAEKLREYRTELDELLAKAESVKPSENRSEETKLLTKLLEVETLNKELIDCLVNSIEVYCGGKINISWKFSNFCDIMNKEDGQDLKKNFDTEIANRVWLYYCSAEGWNKLNEARQKTVTLAKKKGWTVIGESFDNAGLSITASGFKEMQRAVRQGRVDNVIVTSFNDVSTRTKAYQRFEQAVLKRKVKLYDADDNLIIG